MNINFQSIAGQKNPREAILSGMEAEERIVSKTSGRDVVSRTGYAVDINAGAFTDNAYADYSRSIDDISNAAENTDILTRHNFMVLLSNTLSEEDYAKAMEDGFDLKDMAAEDAVTIVDKIKSVLLQSGTVVEGYNDDLSFDKLKKITGSESFAKALSESFSKNDIPLTLESAKSANEAFEQIKDIESLDDSAVKFMVQNDMNATIENVYFAVHSTNGQSAAGRGFYAQEQKGYYAQKAETYDWEQLSPQIDKVIEEAGVDTADENAREDSKWMVSQGIPLTADNLNKLINLKSIEFPVSEEEGANAIAKAISDGKRAVDADLYENSPKAIMQRLRLEEARLEMTSKVNNALVNSGFEIDMAPMEEFISRLKDILDGFMDESTGKAVDEITDVKPVSAREFAFEFTMSRISLIAEGPAEVVGETAGDPEKNSLYKLSCRSEELTEKFRQAGNEYEKLMTAPRTDLGDNIRKAFGNVDDILADLNIEVNSETQRAVRILGYNRMELTPENIEKVRAWDEKLQATVERLKPGAVFELIKEGKNPLSMTIEELSQNLDQSDEQKGDGKNEEKYSRFLYKLEHKGGITQEEKTSFIGIYRLFENLKRTDYQAIGSILKTDKEMTIGNLLNATRNQKAAKRGVDVSVDDDFGGIDLKDTGAEKIDKQIETAFVYYRSKAETVIDNLEPEKLMKAQPTDDTLLQKLADDLKKADSDKELDKAYAQEQLKAIRHTASLKAADPATDELILNSLSLSYNNLEAQIAVRRERRNSDLWDKVRDYEEKELLSDSLSEDDYEENYIKLLDDLSDKLSEELTENADSYIDVRAISLMQKQLFVMGKAAEGGSFEVPVEIDGETISMNVTLKNDESKKTRMDARIQTTEYGLITLSLYGEDERISGMLMTTNSQNPDESEYLEKVRTGLCERAADMLPGIGISEADIAILYRAQNRPVSSGAVSTKAMEGVSESNIETRTLLTMAKAFVKAL